MKVTNICTGILSCLLSLPVVINALPYNPAAASLSFAAHAAVVVATPTPVPIPASAVPSVQPAAPTPSSQPTDGGINSTEKEPTKDFPDIGQDEGLEDDDEGRGAGDRGGGGTSAENKE